MKLPLALLLLALATAAGAQSMYRWVDKGGKVHYGDRPPAAGEASRIEERQSSALAEEQAQADVLQQAVASSPVTIYTQPDCKPCLTGRNHLGKRGIPFNERSISTEADMAELNALLAGQEPLLPLIKVGNKVARGFLASEWDKLLDSAGYPKASR